MNRKATAGGLLAACILAWSSSPLRSEPLEQGAFQGAVSFQQSLQLIHPEEIKFVPAAPPPAPVIQLAREARVTVSGEALAVGVANKAAKPHLDCTPSTVQHTIRSCKVAAGALPSASSLGRRVDGVTLNVHFQGQIINMSVEFSAGNDVDQVLNQLKAAIGQEPKVQYWADAAHLYASYIWVDGISEVEVTKTVKGDAGDGKVRMYVSTLLGGLPISPDDLPQK